MSKNLPSRVSAAAAVTAGEVAHQINLSVHCTDPIVPLMMQMPDEHILYLALANESQMKRAYVNRGLFGDEWHRRIKLRIAVRDGIEVAMTEFATQLGVSLNTLMRDIKIFREIYSHRLLPPEEKPKAVTASSSRDLSAEMLGEDGETIIEGKFAPQDGQEDVQEEEPQQESTEYPLADPLEDIAMLPKEIIQACMRCPDPNAAAEMIAEKWGTPGYGYIQAMAEIKQLIGDAPRGKKPKSVKAVSQQVWVNLPLSGPQEAMLNRLCNRSGLSRVDTLLALMCKADEQPADVVLVEIDAETAEEMRASMEIFNRHMTEEVLSLSAWTKRCATSQARRVRDKWGES